MSIDKQDQVPIGRCKQCIAALSPYKERRHALAPFLKSTLYQAGLQNDIGPHPPSVVPNDKRLGRTQAERLARCLKDYGIRLFSAYLRRNDDCVEKLQQLKLLKEGPQPCVKIAHHCQAEACMHALVSVEYMTLQHSLAFLMVKKGQGV